MFSFDSWQFLTFQWNALQDGWMLYIGIMAAVASSLIGSFLVLRKMSMLGDAISHAVLPGLAIAFFVSQARESNIMFLGAILVGLLTAFLTQWISQVGQVDEGASMGVVFTTLFALGLVLIEITAKGVDLDPDCVLYGNIVLNPLDMTELWGFSVPRAAVRLTLVCILNLVFVVLFFKELKISSFDPALATTAGYSSTWMHYLLMTMVAITSVACFESVGNILVIAMMIVPTATALLLSERLWRVIVIGVILAAFSAIAGHYTSIVAPQALQGIGTAPWTSLRSTHMPGMMAVVSGLLFFGVSLLAPRQGLIVKWSRQRLLSLRILQEDVLAALYRAQENGMASLSVDWLRRRLFAGYFAMWLVGRRLRWQGLVGVSGSEYRLSERGTQRAAQLVRSHRLWEHYLVDKAQVPSERIHAQAEKLEHFTNRELQKQLDQESNSPKQDPHGKDIPESH